MDTPPPPLLAPVREANRADSGDVVRGVAVLGILLMNNFIPSTVFVGFARFDQWERHQLYFLVLAIWMLQLTASPLWLRHFYFGPLEWVWRHLTYLRKPAFRRQPSVAAPTAPVTAG